jgi:hypothetical protein
MEWREVARQSLAIGLVAMPLFFIWHAEVAIAVADIECHEFGSLTNGFANFSGCLTYHLWMYAMLFVSYLGALVVAIDE